LEVVFYLNECRNKTDEAFYRVIIQLSYAVYFVVNASVVVLAEGALVRTAALALLSLGVVAILRRDSVLAEVVTFLAFIFTFFGVGSILYSAILPHFASPEAYNYFMRSVIAAYASLALSLIFGLSLADCCAVRECQLQKR